MMDRQQQEAVEEVMKFIGSLDRSGQKEFMAFVQGARFAMGNHIAQEERLA